MKKYFALFFSLLCSAVLFVSCGDEDKDEDEPRNPIFSFLTTDDNIKVSNGGLNAVVNLNGLDHEIKIPLGGSFTHVSLEKENSSDASWLTAKIEDRVLILSMWETWDAKSATLKITANDANDIVVARLAVNQAAITASELNELQKTYMSNIFGADKNKVPADGNLKTDIWYKLDDDGFAYIRLHSTENGTKIQHGDDVYIDYQGTYFSNYEMNPNDWFLFPEFSLVSTQAYKFDGVSQTGISKFGNGIIWALNAGMRYGDDIDLALMNQDCPPDVEPSMDVKIFAVQFRKDAPKTESKNIRRR